MSNLHQRLFVGSLSLLFIALTVYLSSSPYFRPVFALVVSLIIGGAVWEYYQIARLKGADPLDKLGVVGSMSYVIAVFLSTQHSFASVLPSLTLVGILAAAFIYYFRSGREPVLNLSVTLFAVLYLALPLGCMVSINYFFSENHAQDGRWWLFFLLLVTKMTDTGAYFFGRTFGRHKLAPFISPKKTWEGAIGGCFLAVLSGFILQVCSSLFFATPPFSLGIVTVLFVSLLVAIVAQFGDLAESILKRDSGAKDSNHLPGFGGMLDIVDSLVFTAPLVYILMRIVGETG